MRGWIGCTYVAKEAIFSDKTKINGFKSNGRSWCWIGDGERVGRQHVHETVKHGGWSLTIWECMTAFKAGAWYRIEGRMNRHLYKFILENSCGPLYKITICIKVGWSFNWIMIPSTQARLSKNGRHHNHFDYFNGMHNLQI